MGRGFQAIGSGSFHPIGESDLYNMDIKPKSVGIQRTGGQSDPSLYWEGSNNSGLLASSVGAVYAVDNGSYRARFSSDCRIYPSLQISGNAQFDSDLDIQGNEIKHGEIGPIVYPVELALNSADLGAGGQWFYPGRFTSPRGYIGSSDTHDTDIAIPLTPRIRQGDRITKMEVFFRDADNEDVRLTLTRVEETGGHNIIEERTDNGGGPSDNSLSWGPDDHGLPHTLLNDKYFFTCTLFQTSSVDESRFYGLKVWYDRP